MRGRSLPSRVCAIKNGLRLVIRRPCIDFYCVQIGVVYKIVDIGGIVAYSVISKGMSRNHDAIEFVLDFVENFP